MGYNNSAGLPWGGIELNFFSGSISINYQNRIMDFYDTNAEICDRNGNLLFSSNGVFVSNSQNDTMQNGSGLNPGQSVSLFPDGLIFQQANLIIPVPDDSLKYLLFHQASDDYGFSYCSLTLYYSIIDMSLDGGLGAVTQKNNILFSDSLVPGRLTACKHANGRDWWVLAHQYNSNRFYKYLVTPSIIDGPFIQDIGVVRISEGGQTCFSPDGKKFAFYEPPINDLDIFDFDRCTGNFSNPIHIDFTDSAYLGGVAFSPNSKVLYVSSTSYVYQFDLNAPNIPASQTTVAVWDGYYSPQWPLATTFYLSQIAPDGKIYINCGNSTLDIHVINYPDSLGFACDVCQHCIHLPAYNGFTIPNHPNFFLGAEVGSICDTITSITRLSEADLNLSVSPVPVISQNITISYSPSPESSTISIFNIDGKKVAEYHLPQWSSIQHLKIPQLASGIYLARLSSNSKTGNVKFVVE